MESQLEQRQVNKTHKLNRIFRGCQSHENAQKRIRNTKGRQLRYNKVIRKLKKKRVRLCGVPVGCESGSKDLGVGSFDVWPCFSYCVEEEEGQKLEGSVCVCVLCFMLLSDEPEWGFQFPNLPFWEKRERNAKRMRSHHILVRLVVFWPMKNALR